MEKRCIFHVPNYINPLAQSGSNVRPIKMLQAFRDNEYEVDYIMGYGKERKRQIKEIKKRIKQGYKYEFVYSESSTMPTLLTEKNHLPKYPILDFGFFFYCKQHGIKIALFYRDIQWKFPFYKESVSSFKRAISLQMYRFDLFMYRRLLDIFYLATEGAKQYLSEYPQLLQRSEILMPGCDEVEYNSREITKGKINIFYVGGITGIYDIGIFLEAISEMPNVNAIICCREKEWNNVKEKYAMYVRDNIEIVHASGDKLVQYYEWADICSVFGGNGEYFSIAVPVKMFEYLARNKPMVGVEGTVSGELIKRANIGWVAEYSVEALKRCIEYVVNHPDEIKEKKRNELLFAKDNTWKMRAQKVVRDLEEKNETDTVEKN